MTAGGTARLLCTVHCDTTARSAARRSGGKLAGTRTVRRMPLAGRLRAALDTLPPAR